MYFFIPLWLIVFVLYYLTGFCITLLFLHILTKGEGNQLELIPLSLMWLATLPALLMGIIVGLKR